MPDVCGPKHILSGTAWKSPFLDFSALAALQRSLPLYEVYNDMNKINHEPVKWKAALCGNPRQMFAACMPACMQFLGSFLEDPLVRKMLCESGGRRMYSSTSTLEYERGFFGILYA